MGPIRPWVSRTAGVTTAGLYFVRFWLSAMEAASPTRPAASTQNGEVTWTSMRSSAFWTPGLEILTSILAPFSGSMARWSTRTSMSAQRPVRRAMFAISSRKALRLAERACPHGHVVACLPSLSRAAPHSVPSRFLFFCTDYRGRTRVCMTASWPHAGKQSCAQSGCWRSGVGGNRRRRAHWRCQEQPDVCCWHQCDHAGLWWLC